MRKNTAETMNMSVINKKVLDTLGAKKQVIGKTIFRLPAYMEAFFRQMADMSGLTLREFLDLLARAATKADSESMLIISDAPAEGKRMSYAISEEAKEIFTGLARKYNVSRDNILQSTLNYILHEFEKAALSADERIKYARILDDAFNKMIEIYDSKDVQEAKNKLHTADDPDFSDCDEKINYIEQLYDIDIKEYIRRKEHEIDKTRK